MLMELFDTGRITDSAGITHYCRNHIIIMTSNLCVDDFTKESNIGFVCKEKECIVKYDKIYDSLMAKLLIKLLKS
jgi:ATP-dependent Clp protease ATP-binding subunit ClpA